MLGPRGEAAAGWFWDHVKTYRDNHHIFQDQSWAAYINSTIPMDFHSDGVEVYTGTEFLVFSWSSAVVSDITSYDLQMPIMIIEKQKYIPGVTDVQLVNFIKWNIDVLENGNHPGLSHDGEPFERGSFREQRQGQPLAGGWLATFHAWTGDLKEKVACHRFEKNFMSNFICELCIGGKFGDAYSAQPWGRTLRGQPPHIITTTV